jgi:hypothetical protein
MLSVTINFAMLSVRIKPIMLSLVMLLNVVYMSVIMPSVITLFVALMLNAIDAA